MQELFCHIIIWEVSSVLSGRISCFWLLKVSHVPVRKKKQNRLSVLSPWVVMDWYFPSLSITHTCLPEHFIFSCGKDTSTSGCLSCRPFFLMINVNIVHWVTWKCVKGTSSFSFKAIVIVYKLNIDTKMEMWLFSYFSLLSCKFL